MRFPSFPQGNSPTINTSIFTSVGPSPSDDDRCIPYFFLDHSWLASDGEQDWTLKWKQLLSVKSMWKLLKRYFLLLTHAWKEAFSQQAADRTGHWWKYSPLACLQSSYRRWYHTRSSLFPVQGFFLLHFLVLLLHSWGSWVWRGPNSIHITMGWPVHSSPPCCV